MAIDKNDAKVTNLENIARKYAVYEEDNHLDQVAMRLMDAVVGAKFSDGNTFKYEKDGRSMYRVDLSEKQKNELADKLSDALVYHAYVLKYGMVPKDLKGFLSAKSKTGEYICDDVLASEFGINRYNMRKTIEGMPKVTPEILMNVIGHLVNTQKKKIEGFLTSEASSAGFESMKKFLKKSYDSFGNPQQKSQVYGLLEKATDLDALLPLYGEAAQFYKPVKKK